MNKEDLEKTLQYFHQHEYNDDEYNPKFDKVYNHYLPVKMKGYFYHSDSDFCITILDNEENSVYQKGTEHDTVGVELKTFDDLKIRYKSFTGEEL